MTLRGAPRSHAHQQTKNENRIMGKYPIVDVVAFGKVAYFKATPSRAKRGRPLADAAGADRS